MASSFFSDLLNSPTNKDTLRDTERHHHHHRHNNVLLDQTDSDLPKFKSTPPPSLPLSPTPLFSPSYFSIPHGFSLSELLDSPVLLNSSHVSLSKKNYSSSYLDFLVDFIILVMFSLFRIFCIIVFVIVRFGCI